MIRQAVKEAPAVLVWLVVDAILALILQLLELYVTPVLLRDIEEQIALKELVTTILFFSSGILLLTGLKKYINNATYQMTRFYLQQQEVLLTRCFRKYFGLRKWFLLFAVYF